MDSTTTVHSPKASFFTSTMVSVVSFWKLEPSGPVPVTIKPAWFISISGRIVRLAMVDTSK